MYLSARDLGGRGLYILARGDIIDQALDRVILVLAVAVGEEVQSALAFVKYLGHWPFLILLQAQHQNKTSDTFSSQPNTTNPSTVAMHFSAIALTLLASTLPATLAVAVSVANPQTDPNLLFARQTVNGQNSCAGPIVNVYAYLAVSCSKSKSSDSPIPFGLKFALFKPLVTEYESSCKNIPDLNNDDGKSAAKSLAFSADGNQTDRCKLLVYTDKGCVGNPSVSYNLNGKNLDGAGVGNCQTRVWRSAKVVCGAKNTAE